MKWKESKCSKCHYCARTQFNNLKFCRKRKYYPDPEFINFWGCDDFKEKYIDLLEEL